MRCAIINILFKNLLHCQIRHFNGVECTHLTFRVNLPAGRAASRPPVDDLYLTCNYFSLVLFVFIISYAQLEILFNMQHLNQYTHACIKMFLCFQIVYKIVREMLNETQHRTLSEFAKNMQHIT